ncbi:uncharacterized protein LOC116339146 [Contarinia nasturtii]|uniref:uncharacterized protein LOC116339146 n=1 Tax=Contarinia nasturtii TaxID=265458 RepID=UPI0012D3A052|nr:uncharacterized protein LOC116339146 [Contarinia nasturtii]
MVKSLIDYGTPEEEAWRWKFIPAYIKIQRKYDHYLYSVKYYDKPEGEDLLGKLIAINRTCIPWGFTVGVTDALMHGGRFLPTYQQQFGRFVHFMWPTIAVPTAFATTTYFCAKIRQKDDLWNYSAGAIAAGSVVGGWQRCHITGWTASLFFLICACAQRVRIEEGWKWWNLKEQQLNGDHRWHKFGWNLYTDPLPKNYTTSEN